MMRWKFNDHTHTICDARNDPRGSNTKHWASRKLEPLVDQNPSSIDIKRKEACVEFPFPRPFTRTHILPHAYTTTIPYTSELCDVIPLGKKAHKVESWIYRSHCCFFSAIGFDLHYIWSIEWLSLRIVKLIVW